jgi:hypothetical protein
MTETDTDTDVVVANPELKLEDVRENPFGNYCSGRGSETAAPRGYNSERLAAAVFGSCGLFLPTKEEGKPWFDTKAWTEERNPVMVESKSCIDRYPSGGYGQFRIWRSPHITLSFMDSPSSRKRTLYFFLVYTIKNENGNQVSKEVGKLVVDSMTVDGILDNWKLIDHSTMGLQQVRNISWHLLLNRLDISVDRFRQEDTIVLIE